jgi:putative addiction module component (TIGR02574 family)
MTVKKLKEAVRKLTTKERILFVQYILDTVSEDTAGMDTGHLSDEWKKELEKRSVSYSSGEQKTYTWEEVKTRLIQKNK